MNKIAWLKGLMYPVLVGVTDSPAAIKRFQRKNDLPVANPLEDSYATTVFYGTPEGTYVLLAFPEDMHEDEDVCPAAVIAHESMHAVQLIWRTIGEQNPSMEAEAYLLDHIVEHAMRELGYSVVKKSADNGKGVIGFHSPAKEDKQA